MKLVKLFVAIIVAQFCLSTVFAASVAEVNGVQYESLQAAVQAATSGQTVKVIADHEIDTTAYVTIDNKSKYFVTVDKELTIDLNGCTIILDGSKIPDNVSVRAFIGVLKAEGNLTMIDSSETKSGKIIVDAERGASYGIAYIFYSSGRLTMEGGYYELNTPVSADIFLYENNLLTVNGGDYVQIIPEGNCCIFNGNGSGIYSALVTGGTFNVNPGNINTGSNMGEVVYPTGYDACISESGKWIIEKNENITAKIGTVKYKTLQDAVNNAKDGDTVVLLTDCSENITYTQTPDTEENPGVKFTIDGDGKTMTGKITIGSSVLFGDISDKIGLTIKNVNFTTENNSLIFIDATPNDNRYKCNLTIENCSFEGPGSGSSVVPVKSKYAVNLQMIDCEANGVNSLFQSSGNGIGYAFIGCKVTDSGRGLNLDSVEGEVLIKNCEISALATKYGIRLDGDALKGYNITIEDSSIDAFIPVCVRNASQNGSITFQGENTITQCNTDGIWCAIGTSEYDSNGVLPSAPTGQVVVTLNDTGLSMDGVYGNYVAPPENDVFDDIIAGNINIGDEAAADVKVKIMGFADVVGGSEKVAAYFSEVYGSAKAPASAVLATTGDLFKISEYFSLPLLAKAPTVSVSSANSAYGTVAFCFTLVDGDNDIYVTASTKVKQLIKYVEKLEDDFICDENELDITFADGMIKVDFKNSDKPSGFIKVDFTVPSVN